MQAASTPIVIFSPPSTSPIAVPLRVGPLSGHPVVLISPPTACPMMSYPARSLYGPQCPKPETQPQISFGLISFRTSYPRPSFSMVPGRKFSRTISAFLISSLKTSLPFSFFRLRVMLRLLRFRFMQQALSPFTIGM